MMPKDQDLENSQLRLTVQEILHSHQNNLSKPFSCLKCLEDEIPFLKLNNNEFYNFIKYDITNNSCANINLNLEPSQQAMINKINAYIERNNRDCEDEIDQPINCGYFSCDEFIEANFDNKSSFSIMHLNIHSITLQIEELCLLLQALIFWFDIVAISKSKLKGLPIVDISLYGYQLPILHQY